MAPAHAPLMVDRRLAFSLKELQAGAVPQESARQTLGTLLQSALELEYATIPTYLSAAFSLTSNRQIEQLISRTAVEEMLHMTAVANIMNAIGVAPDIKAAIPLFPYDLEVLDPPLRLDLRSFSLDLVENLFMKIEAPEVPVVYDMGLAEPPKTIGQFYAGIIEIIDRDKISDLFINAARDSYKQRKVEPNFRPIAYLNDADDGTYPLEPEIDFMITNKESAVRHLAWVVDQGEGEAEYNPLTAEGIPGHYYRFQSILKGKFLVKDTVATKGYSFSGGSLPFDPAGVHEFDENVDIDAYPTHPDLQKKMREFGKQYTALVDYLHAAFNCPAPDKQSEADAAYEQAMGVMRRLRNSASSIIRKAQQEGVNGGLPFKYG
ncbi:ferritin-like protein [Rhizobium ruizarguesonis]